MADLNLARITSRVADIRANLRILGDYAKSPDCEFLGNLEAIAAAKYAFIVMIEATVSIATHLCARLLSKAPSSQRESFELLGDSGVLPAALASELAKMAGFRNVLVHGYAEVDNASVLTIMREQLGDLEEFLSVVSTLCRAGG
ncbi:MAG: DUF86 domain-containing protein [Bacillota bacterium]